MTQDEKRDLQDLAFPKMVRVMTYQSIAIVVLAIAVIFSIYLAVTKQPLTFAVSPNGSVIPIVPLNEPLVGDARIIGFSDECLRSAFSHDFLNARLSVARASECFTAEGNLKFAKEIEPLLDDLVKKRMVMTPTLQPAVIVSTKVLSSDKGKIYSWETQTKMTLYRRGTSTQIEPQTYVVSMLIRRVPLEENVRGVGVEQINVRPG